MKKEDLRIINFQKAVRRVDDLLEKEWKPMAIYRRLTEEEGIDRAAVRSAMLDRHLPVTPAMEFVSNAPGRPPCDILDRNFDPNSPLLT